MITRSTASDDHKVILWDRCRSCTFPELDEKANRAAQVLLGRVQREDLSGARVVFLLSPSISYVLTQWAIWRAGGVTVPLCISHPLPEQLYVSEDCQAEILIFEESFRARAQDLQSKLPQLQLVSVSELAASEPPVFPLPPSSATQPAQILYTSGTTGKPKGVVTTHANLLAQIQSLIQAWGWCPQDHTLLVLPLHHTHGIVNVLGCALAAGASLEIFESFEPQVIWSRFCEGREGKRTTVFMAVPAIYSALIECYEKANPEEQSRFSQAASRLRLMVSGSAALPVSTWKKWKSLTGQEILERYGMTEIGMALSNPLDGERRPGTVGQPLPFCEVRLAEGEIQVRGPTVFQGYFGKPEATAAAFSSDGWFRTGDCAEVSADGYFRILGRNSVDILKTAGYKVSALEIEEELRQHPAIRDVAVVGLPDEKWGEIIAAAVSLHQPANFWELESWLRERLAPYKVPRKWKSVESLPRNALGKVLKPEVLKWFKEN